MDSLNSVKNFDFNNPYSPEMFDKEFIKQNEEYFLNPDVPERISESYYNKTLTLRDYSNNLQYFENKKVAHAIGKFLIGYGLVRAYGDDIYQLFKNYKPIVDKLIKSGSLLSYMDSLNENMTQEQRKEKFNEIVYSYFSQNIKSIDNLEMLKLVTDFVPLEKLSLPNDSGVAILKKYGIDELIKSDFDIKCLTQIYYRLSNLEQLKKLEKVIEADDISKLVSNEHLQLINKYGIDKLMEYGIQDLKELNNRNQENNLYNIKEQLEKRPSDLVNLGNFAEEKLNFINKYGIDNIIRLDEESNGMFSHVIYPNKDIYLSYIACMEGNETHSLNMENEFTYEEFKDIMYETLKYIIKYQTIENTNYDFIGGSFREEYQDIFIDKSAAPQIKEKFYKGDIDAETVRKNPELIELLKEKDLTILFSKKMNIESNLVKYDENGRISNGMSNPVVNMAKYLSSKIGPEEFLKICADYGECLDKIEFGIYEEVDSLTPEYVRNQIEIQLYEQIKNEGLEYAEYLPQSFKEKHPDLFLPDEIDKDIRNRFYKGEMTFEDIRRNPEIKDELLTKDLGVGFRGFRATRFGMWSKLSMSGETNSIQQKKEMLDLAEEYGNYLRYIDINVLDSIKDNEKKILYLRTKIEENILNRKSLYNENVPEFFKEKNPEMFLSDDAPEELKKIFYDNDLAGINFSLIKYNPEWQEFLVGKALKRAFSETYSKLFEKFDDDTLLKLGMRNTETIEEMVVNHRESALEKWYKATGGKFIPHHVVMLNFPEGEIDSFLSNSKKWSQLMKLDRYSLSANGKSDILKAAYSLGVFQGDDDGFNKIMQLFTDIPQELSQEEYDKVDRIFSIYGPEGDVWDDSDYDEETISLFEKAYTLNDDGKYVFSMDKQKNKNSVRIIREILERAQITGILTLPKAHQIFDSFAMEYNPDFAKFFNENIEEILSNPEYTKDIASIQRQFTDIVITNSGRKLTLEVAQDYIRNVVYTDIDVGNESVAEQAKIAGYSQKAFEAIQKLYNEGETREFSSIPRIQGENNGYTYEMLRCDDPLALTIGTLTDCCQEIYGAGQTSMEHSVVSPDGRVFVVRDDEGRIVAQSWFWRNQYTGCFDNIEIPNRIFKLYEKQYPETGKHDLTKDVLEVYKKAAIELIQDDKKVYQELLENGTITQEQYDSLLLGKVTIGLGYNDIADAIKNDKTIHKESDKVVVKSTERLPHLYTDAHIQYIIAERENIVESSQENLYVHQDDIQIYDGSNMTNTVLLMMKRMEKEAGGYNLLYLRTDDYDYETELQKSQKIINQLAKEYGLDSNSTKVMATARMALIYNKEDDKIKIADVFTAPIKENLTDEQKQKVEKHINYQLKKALKQLGAQDIELDINSLDEKQQEMLQTALKEIEKENSERRER